MSDKTKGVIFGIIAAVCYGTNPLGVLFLYKEGFNTISTVFYRYLSAVLMLAVLLVSSGENFKISKKEAAVTAFLGIFFGASSLGLYESFNYMDAGIASTILFCYPVMVSVIMAAFFHERIYFSTVAALITALAGVVTLSKGGSQVSLTGVALVLVSSLTYAVYIVSVNRTKVKLSNVKMTFFATLSATFLFLFYALFSPEVTLQPIINLKTVFWSLFLGLVPTVVSLVFMNKAIKLVGAAPASIIGALEPLTAVIIGVCVFGEQFSLRLLVGILLILSAVVTIILSDENNKINRRLKYRYIRYLRQNSRRS